MESSTLTMKLCLKPKDLLAQMKTPEAAIQWVVNRILAKEIPFPYRRLFTDPAATIFDRLRHFDPTIVNHRYRLYAYYPKYKLYLPPFYQGSPQLILSTKENYDQIDILSDLFLEEVRVSANHKGFLSPLECWEDHEYCTTIVRKAFDLAGDGVIDLRVLRDAIYLMIPETKQFRLTWAKGILKILQIPENSRILDISAGWGDRLLTAIAMNCQYLGFDPNTRLREGHEAMIRQFGDLSKHTIRYEPFEQAVLPENNFDLIITSPPFFNLEEYTDEINQSIRRYPQFLDWMVQFLFRSLFKAWQALKDGGYMAIHMGDTKTIRICEPMNLFIEQLLPNSSHEGIIGVAGEMNIPRPVWVWRKSPFPGKRNIWGLPMSKRPFNVMYPEYRNALVAMQLNEINPQLSSIYWQRCQAIETVLVEVNRRHPQLNRRLIVSVLPESAILSMLEVLDLPQVITSVEQIVSRWRQNVLQ
jgi:tRNA1(Val) A37 N6-methylase TrmN6